MHTPAFWYKNKKTPAALLLWPLGMAYAAVATLNGRRRSKNPYFAGVPVISVGNLVAGGAGKTPVVEWLAAHYASQGHQVAIISRGYGGQAIQPMQVNPRLHTALEAGDEPFALARRFYGQPVQVWVGRHRPSVARRAEEAGATLLILDDGFQRRDVARDCDILVLSGEHPTPWGNGLPLPAGPLRECLSARSRAHFAIVLNEKPQNPLPFYGLPAYRLATRLTEASTAPLRGKNLLAFSGLAHPNKFLTSLKNSGLTVTATASFPDHHAYTARNLQTLQTKARETKTTLVTTAKDAAKLPGGFAHVVELELTGAQQDDILTEINQRLQGGL